MDKLTPQQAQEMEKQFLPLQMRAWSLLREPPSFDRDEAVIITFLEILSAAERLYQFYGATTSHHVDHELFFPVLARRREPSDARQIVDRLIRLRGTNTPKWIEEAWKKASDASQLPEKPLGEAKLQARAFQRVLTSALNTIARWGTRSDALIDPKVALHPNASQWQAGDALVKVFHFIVDESEKPQPRITDSNEAEATANEIVAVLYDSGLYKMSEKRRWRKVS
jgi:hypothetical protein